MWVTVCGCVCACRTCGCVFAFSHGTVATSSSLLQNGLVEKDHVSKKTLGFSDACLFHARLETEGLYQQKKKGLTVTTDPGQFNKC